jgi:capsular polysaccharide transport system permease protein
MQAQRSSLAVTLSVWRALFLREALGRLFAARARWFWVIVEPAFHVAYLMVLFAAIRVGTVAGMEVAVWIMVGLLAFFTFRRTGAQLEKGVREYRPLFAYRQVHPVDAVLVGAVLEGLLISVISLLMMAGAALVGYAVWPADPLAVLEAFLGLWLLGLGYGLITSVASDLADEARRVVNLTMTPLYIISGVMIPLQQVAQPYRGWLMLNPVAHGLEAARLGFSSHYHAVPELNISYLYSFALVTIFLGLVLYRRFAMTLMTQ